MTLDLKQIEDDFAYRSTQANPRWMVLIYFLQIIALWVYVVCYAFLFREQSAVNRRERVLHSEILLQLRYYNKTIEFSNR